MTVEVPIEEGPRQRPDDADEEILTTCLQFRQLTGRDLSLVTADTAMRLRAQAHGISVLKLPGEYERRRVAPTVADG